MENLYSLLEEKKALNDLVLQGYLSSYGFLNDEICFEKVEQTDQYLNYRNFLFIVTPKLNSEFHDEYKRSKKNLLKLQRSNFRKRDYINSLQSKTQNLYQGVDREIELNKTIVKNYEEKEVLYGAEI